VAVDGLLDSSAALIEGVTGQARNVEGVHDRDRVGEFLGGGGLESGEPVHRHDLDRRTPVTADELVGPTGGRIRAA
jgi:hypothetical protein